MFRSLISPLILLFMGLFTLLSGAQDSKPTLSATRPGERDLVLKTIGEARVLGRRAAFRIYESPDGTQSSVWYGTFASDAQAETAIKQWIQPYKVSHKDQAKDLKGNVIGERIVGSVHHETGGVEYLLVRRDILNYWWIQSKSLRDAMQLDASIDASSLVGQ